MSPASNRRPRVRMLRRKRPSSCVSRAEVGFAKKAAYNEFLGNDIILAMDFSQLLDGAEVLLFQGSAEIRGLDYDSRRVRRGFAFVAMRGEKTDGNHYIDQAIANGAVAIVSDSGEVPPRPDWVTGLGRIPSIRRCLRAADGRGCRARRLQIGSIPRCCTS